MSLIRMEQITKAFGAVKALNKVDFELKKGKSMRFSGKTERERQPL